MMPSRAKWLDRIYDAVESGEIPDPFVEQQSPGATHMRPMRSEDPAGTPVSVVMDDQTIVRSKTRSETWCVGGSHQVARLEERCGCYLVKRYSVLEPAFSLTEGLEDSR